MINRIIILCLFVSISTSISAINEVEAKNIVSTYYQRLQSYADNPEIFQRGQDLLALFVSDENVVINDLLFFQGKENKEDDLSNYLSTILAVWERQSKKLTFSYVFEESSCIIRDEDAVNSLPETTWITTRKKIIDRNLNQEVGNVRETFKIIGNKIQTICTPETATCEISFIDSWADKHYIKMFDAFKKLLSSSGAKIPKHYIYLMIETLNKHKVEGIPSIVQKWLSLFYEAKYSNSKNMHINHGYYYEDMRYLLQDSTMIYPFIHGLMPIYKIGKSKRGSALRFGDTKYAFMNEQGKMVTSYKFNWAEPISKEYGIARVGTGYIQVPFRGTFMNYGIINAKGEILTTNQYLSIQPFYNGYAVVEDILSRKGFINPQGEEVFPCSYEYLSDYKCGWFGYRDGDKAGFMNFTGEKINDESYYNVQAFDEGCNLARVSKKIDGIVYYGCIDSTGREVIPIEYYSITINSKEGIIILKKTISGQKIIQKIKD